MYSIFITLALCLVAAARPTARGAPPPSPVGTKTGISCTVPEGCFNQDIVTCIDGEFVVTQNCAAPTTCLTLPIDNSTENFGIGCSTTEVQTALFGLAFGGVDKIPTDRK
ncbi:hypothetical protein DFH09DRAFT_1355870 [Mycena vulgaris]|nr:hypothetical protein DFH09DRAFT_1355870 [Mycena vulgaris]